MSEPVIAEATGISSKKYEHGVAHGIDFERRRIGAILYSKEAEGRENLARSLAFDTNQSAKEALKVLAAAEKSRRQADQGFLAAMAAVGNPSVGVDGDRLADSQIMDADSAKAIFAARKEQVRASLLPGQGA